MIRRSKKVILRCLSAIALLSLSGCDGFLQVRGVVRDTMGKPISGARVRLEHGDGRKFEEKTDRQGCFSTSGTVPSGRYEYSLLVDANGYSPATTKVRLTVEQDVTVVLARKGSSGISRAEKVLQVPCRSH